MGRYPLNGSHLTEADDLEMMSTVADWPLGDRLPVKRRVEGDIEHGVVYADEECVIRHHQTSETDEPAFWVYSTYAEMIADGWRVD